MIKLDEFDEKIIGLFRSTGKACDMDDLSSTIVAIVYMEPEDIAMDDLAEKTGYSLASISNKIKMLESFGLIERKSKPGTRKVFLSMEKDFIKIWKDQLIKAQEMKVKLIKDKLPAILKEYKTKARLDKQRKKIRILENYYNQTLKFEEIINHMLEKLD